MTPDGPVLVPSKYRVNPSTRKWEEIPADVLEQIQKDFDEQITRMKSKGQI